MGMAEPSPVWRGRGYLDSSTGGSCQQPPRTNLGLGSGAGGGVFVSESTLRLTNNAGRVSPISEGYAVVVSGANFTAEAGRTPALDSTAEAGVTSSLEACPTTAETAGDSQAACTRVLAGGANVLVVGDALAVVIAIPSPPTVLAAPTFLTLSTFTAAGAALRVLAVARLTDVEAVEMPFCGDLRRSRLFAQADTDRRGCERSSGHCLKCAPP